jgi:hypothetical protein
MKLYKYRTSENLERDLALYSENYFWASSKESLNDENEFTYNAEPFFEELKVYEKLEKTLFGTNSSVSNVIESAKDLFNHAQNSGVFSLSKDPKDSGMWSLYASKGKGYCLVFDSDALMKIVDDPISEQRFLLPVDYSKEAPNLFLDDMKDQKVMFTKMLATKSESWIKESEVRIVTDRPGKQRFLPSALIGVIFGTNTDEETKKKIFAAFENRNLEVYQLHKLENTYEYFIESLTSLIRKQELPFMSYDYVNAPSATVDNFYVKANEPLTDEHSIKNFVKKFKHDIAERKCNIFLMDADTDLSKLTDCFHIDEEYVEEYLIAEMHFDSYEVLIEKIFN